VNVQSEAPRSGRVPSLPEAHRSIPVVPGASWLRKVFAFAGPGYLVAVGYMDPGNWATDIGGGSKFGYTLLSVIVASNLMAMLLQALSAKLGIVTGRDLAQACREHYPRRWRSGCCAKLRSRHAIWRKYWARQWH
jgi:manganese transport protein